MGRRLTIVTGTVAVAAAVALGGAACGDGGTTATDTTASTAPNSTAPNSTAPNSTAPSSTDPSSADPSPSTTSDAPAPTVAVDPATFAADGKGIAWASPTNNIWCRIGSVDNLSGCQARDAPVPAGAECDTPNYTLDQLTKGFILGPDGVQPSCFNQGVFSTEFPKVLEYGQSVTSEGYTCTSRATGMECTTGGGHGFVLSAQESRGY